MICIKRAYAGNDYDKGVPMAQYRHKTCFVVIICDVINRKKKIQHFHPVILAIQ